MFRKIARHAATQAGSSWAFCLAFLLVAGWLLGGFVAGFTDTYQLIINTSTTIITFLMVFLIQNAQNTDTASVHVKLDELIKAVEGANNKVIQAENLPPKELENARKEYEKLAEKEEV